MVVQVKYAAMLSSAPNPTKKITSSRWSFLRSDLFAIDHSEVRGPDFRLRRGAPPPRRGDSAQVGKILGLDEHLGEGRVRHVVRLRSQRELSVRGNFDVARPAAGV